MIFWHFPFFELSITPFVSALRCSCTILWPPRHSVMCRVQYNKDVVTNSFFFSFHLIIIYIFTILYICTWQQSLKFSIISPPSFFPTWIHCTHYFWKTSNVPSFVAPLTSRHPHILEPYCTRTHTSSWISCITSQSIKSNIHDITELLA